MGEKVIYRASGLRTIIPRAFWGFSFNSLVSNDILNYCLMCNAGTVVEVMYSYIYLPDISFFPITCWKNSVLDLQWTSTRVVLLIPTTLQYSYCSFMCRKYFTRFIFFKMFNLKSQTFAKGRYLFMLLKVAIFNTYSVQMLHIFAPQYKIILSIMICSESARVRETRYSHITAHARFICIFKS